ncbi:MAG: type IX secretion system outer membrane channel protein PorV [Bacteroidetes bacterium]|nr:type IX secretion system outer membrane channel protein PorV [Bacteroidota bacterium]
MKIRLSFLFLCALAMTSSYGQTGASSDSRTEQSDGSRVISTAVPFLTIAPDARAGGMGNVGVATTPDAYSMFWNPAKYAFIDKTFGFGIGYVPWLRQLVNDIGLYSVVGYGKIGDKQAIAGSLRFFSMGEVQFTNDYGENTILVKPNEFALDATYARKFSREFSGAVAGRFVYSNLIPGGGDGTTQARPGTSVAADVAIYYHHEMEVKGISGASIDFGLNISNIGSKMSYSSSSIVRDFIPTTLRLGPSFTMDIDDYNRFSISLDLSKLLVPTPPVYLKDHTGSSDSIKDNKKVIYKGKNPDVSPVMGMIQSFYDAPYGFKEEMQEINIALAAEYWYNKLFSVRAGYFYESVYKGDRQFFTLGAGLRYNVFGLDFSYLIPIRSNNPLQHTLQFTLLFNFDNTKKPEKAGATN